MSTMKAGPELDAMVTERVLEWEWKRSPDAYPEPHYAWVAPRPQNLGGGEWEVARHTPAFSTDIAAAWQVVEKIRSQGRYFEIGSAVEGDNETWTCVVGQLREDDPTGDRPLVFDCATAPLAICLASLKAVGAPQ
jgi:hypothetical protein